MSAHSRRGLPLSLLLLIVAAALPHPISLAAQAPAPAPQSAAPVAPATPPAFDVAAIKPNKSGNGNSGTNTNNDSFTGTNVTLESLIASQAYGIPESRVFGGPKWINAERFDIQAKIDSSVADQLKALQSDQQRLEMQAMFQQLLADRFKLAAHWETREMPVYALVIAKSGPKLQATKETKGNSGTSTSIHGPSAQITATNLTLAEWAETLTQSLSGQLGRVVIDKTGIEGKYDLTLKWTVDSGTASASNGTDGAASPTDAGPSIFTAIQEQLGLKLEPAKAPVKVLIIDHAEMPSEN